jgi:hypothetical protein
MIEKRKTGTGSGSDSGLCDRDIKVPNAPYMFTCGCRWDDGTGWGISNTEL